ncbi:hypothetical protein CVIC8964_0656 [Campylobacter vicugnae]|uniref:Uncharacterized protein n=1 Tax=Campylobacter vicugnae TaxID=1660076 RepID=A0A1X9T0R9_9BACT|nr:hypothetical protein [Campylobacter sp. RM8964]ARR02071.1 hypothetical protein CVIC8964_0656 [Campylobacter sp. RM8964]
MNKKQLKIIAKEYANIVIKDFLYHEINSVIDNIKEHEFDFKTAYELRSIITTIALKNIISDRIALNNIQATISFDDKAFKPIVSYKID